MADILIRGIDVPTNQDVTIRIDPNGEVYVYGTYPTLILRAVTLPRGHGRLVDADALMKKGIELDWSVQKWVQEVDIMTATTIVPAEGWTNNG